MTRCDYDGVFYRVFCITLLAIALSFTVVLTNVFVDIDGLLTNKRGTRKDLDTDTTVSFNNDVDVKLTPETVNADPRYDEKYEDSYRSKRSLETKNFLFHIKNPHIKNMLTNRLATLLDELDAGDNGSNKNHSESEISIEKNKEDISEKEGNEMNIKNKEDPPKHEDLHKMLLQGIAGHTNFNELHDKKYTSTSRNKETNKDSQLPSEVKPEGPMRLVSKHIEKTNTFATDEEKNILSEIMSNKELRKQVIEATKKIKEDNNQWTIPHEGSKIIIKTIIDIKSAATSITEKTETTSNENIKALLKLINNSKTINSRDIDGDNVKITPQTIKITQIPPERDSVTFDYKTKKISNEGIKQRQYNKNINEYIQDYFSSRNNNEQISMKQETARVKRHVKIRNDEAPDSTRKPSKEEDDELFVEIETHFDSKGTNGEKKKKLIRNIIEKIQKAIHSKSAEAKKKKFQNVPVKKRVQDPLNQDHISRLINKITLPYDAVIHRHLDPINKIFPVQYTVDKSTEIRKNIPKFLAITKSINSAEMSDVDIDYNRVIIVNGIPQRIQQPLSDDRSEEAQTDTAYNDMGQLKFFIKDIDGSGFSIGFNQYVDELPDKEAMKLFTGLENVIQTYYKTYGQTDTDTEAEKIEIPSEANEEANNYPIEHIVVRRSTDKKFSENYRADKYKIVFDNKFLPYQTFPNMYKTIRNKTKTTKFIKSDDERLISTFLVDDDDVFSKNLKRFDIYRLANLIKRKKRSFNIKKISNLKNKIKINRFLNTKTIARKKIFLNKKRSKRQIDKIRIIASDSMPSMRRNSRENLFVMSDENILADRAVVREAIETPDYEHDRIDEDHYDIISPYIYEEQAEQPLTKNTYFDISRHNTLMSKYPHIFMEEISRSKEEIFPDNSVVINKYINPSLIPSEVETATQQISAETNMSLPSVKEIVNAVVPQGDKTNYKLTVKIMPKNTTGMNHGFKEIHTIINKSYNKGGLMYSSLVNVSEISKVTKLNKTQDPEIINNITQLLSMSQVMRQRQKIKLILEQHKNRIEQQLKHLNQEKQTLERMALTTEPAFEVDQDKYFELVLPSNPPKVLRLSKEEVSKLAVASLLKQPENISLNLHETTTKMTTTPSLMLSSAVQQSITTIPTTSAVPSTTESIKQIERQSINQKTKMFNVIERNGNLTNEILKKIDKNTEVLQAFLHKLAENNDLTQKRKSEDLNPIKYDLNYLQGKTNYPPVTFNQVPPIIDAHNDSHLAMPFVYAYQQPYPVPSKSDTSVASVVFHGHIHANAINRRRSEEGAPKEDKQLKVDKLNSDKKGLNQTKFFIDELENDFKVMPVIDVKKKDNLKLVNHTTVY